MSNLISIERSNKMDIIKIISDGKEKNKEDKEIIQTVNKELLERLKNMNLIDFSQIVKEVLINPTTAKYQILLEISLDKM